MLNRDVDQLRLLRQSVKGPSPIRQDKGKGVGKALRQGHCFYDDEDNDNGDSNGHNDGNNNGHNDGHNNGTD